MPMPNEIDDKVAGAKTALAKANAKFPSPKPTPATAAPKTSSVANMSKGAPMMSAGEDAAAGIRAKQANIAEYNAALPKMHKGGIVPGKKGEDVPVLAQAGEKVIPADKAEGRSSEYRKVYVARRQSRQGGGNKPITGEKHDSKKAEKSGQPSAKQAGAHVKD